jgi:hypothetical protein
MKLPTTLLTLTLAVFGTNLPSHAASAPPDADGWRPLFDGASFDGWRLLGQPSTPGAGWQIEEGILKKIGGQRGGNLVTEEFFEEFEFTWEWRIPRRANNGVKYFVLEQRGAGIGHEYQMIDDTAVRDPKQKTGSFYDVLPPAPDRHPPLINDWNHSRIIVRGQHVEHWLNRERILEYTLGSAEVLEAVSRSKFREIPAFGTRVRGRIMLTDHNDETWFRNLQIRTNRWVPLFNGLDLDGWIQRGGKARYHVDRGEIVGQTVPNTPNSFLCTQRQFTNFILELDFKPMTGLNSGIQVRSECLDDDRTIEADPKPIRIPAGRVHGYQIEIDPSDRAWTGGIYDEGRRGWLQDLKDNEPARQAFRANAWNHLRIECRGDSLRTWLNGVPAAHLRDPMTPAGFIGLQVHGVGDRADPLEVRWRNLWLLELP